MEKKVLNLVNFVRGCEPRKPMDLLSPVKLELETDRKFHLPHTFLLQYDAMEREDFINLFRKELKNNPNTTELGIWFEMGRSLTEKAGIPWRGRPGYDWDWYVNPGFLEAYLPEERERLIDEAFRRFKELFGFYPSIAGSWLLDAHSMAYMNDKYSMKAFCVCREQYGVDAYTLWGGYYSGAYYPSRKNMLSPAQSKEMQIDIPVFRMLGIDPIYGYDEEKYHPKLGGCYTMEPSWPCGKNRDVMDWYFREYYENPVLNFSEATTGQENSFGLQYFGESYPQQIEQIAAWMAAGKLAVQTLGETAEAFRKHFPATPPSVLSALTDWSENGHRSVWYSSKFYRSNLFLNGTHLFFRDIHKFDENFTEPHLTSPCTAWSATYETLPFVDGRLWSKDGRVSELAFCEEVKEICEEINGQTVCITVRFSDGHCGTVRFLEDQIILEKCGSLCYRPGASNAEITVKNNGFACNYHGFSYLVSTNADLKISDTETVLSGESYRLLF